MYASKLKEIANFIEVCEYDNIPLFRSGCKTPDPHPDPSYKGYTTICIFGDGDTEQNHTHCHVYPNGVYCFSCQQHTDVFGMVMNYHRNVLHEEFTYRDALKVVGDTYGGHELYRSANKPGINLRRMPFTMEELSKIHLGGHENGVYLAEVSGHSLSLQRLYEEDPKLFFYICRTRARESIKEYQDFVDHFDPKTFDENAIKREVEYRINIANKIFRMSGGKNEPRRAKKLFKL
jgi:hypothetical protein